MNLTKDFSHIASFPQSWDDFHKLPPEQKKLHIGGLYNVPNLLEGPPFYLSGYVYKGKISYTVEKVEGKEGKFYVRHEGGSVEIMSIDDIKGFHLDHPRVNLGDSYTRMMALFEAKCRRGVYCSSGGPWREG